MTIQEEEKLKKPSLNDTLNNMCTVCGPLDWHLHEHDVIFLQSGVCTKSKRIRIFGVGSFNVAYQREVLSSRSIQSGVCTKCNRIRIFGVGSFNVAYQSIRRREVLFSTWAINMLKMLKYPSY